MMKACIEASVRYLVYTSSESVIVDHRDFVMADETEPYPAQDELIMAPYGATKQQAEMLLLQANGSPVKRGWYTLRSGTMSGHVRYKRNSLACKMQGDSACKTGDSACKLILLYL